MHATSWTLPTTKFNIDVACVGVRIIEFDTDGSNGFVTCSELFVICADHGINRMHCLFNGFQWLQSKQFRNCFVFVS